MDIAESRRFAFLLDALDRFGHLMRARLTDRLEGSRRFGARGLALCVLASAIIGPPRDYGIAATFPEWMTFSPGIAPVVADAVIYVLLVVVGYEVMRMVAGPDQGDSLARRRSHA